MKIAYVEISGFRGFRERTRITVPPGFLVVGGANGSGKSTICDAIEYAFTGSIRQGTEHKEKGESIQEYLWWRGAETAQPAYVEVGLLGADGRATAVRRGPAGLVVSPEDRLESLLMAEVGAPDDCLRQLCRTAILRDEEITSISVDLKETDRFSFVRGALGGADFSAVTERLRDVDRVLVAHGVATNRDYDIERARAASLSTRLSQARTEAASVSDMVVAASVLSTFTGVSSGDLSTLTANASKRLGEQRRRTEAIADCLRRLGDLESRRVEIATSAHAERVLDLETRVKSTEERVAEAGATAIATATALEAVRGSSPAGVALAQLLEYGERVGLKNGICPLCGAEREPSDFAAHVRDERSALVRQNALVAQRAREAADATLAISRLKVEAERLRGERDAARQAETALAAAISRIGQELRSLAIDTGGDVTQTMAFASAEVESLRAQAERVDAAIGAVRASHAAALVLELEGEMRAVQERLATTETLRARLATARAQAREAEAAVLRLQGELVDEQLGAIAPLLVEIYERLRPHVDWRDLRYNLRGDVRRMLSLEVGDGLNPSFMFSSGQRRAVGLAFFLAIHLSRSWCKLDSLVLDDPVQHVDDYRALHLAEVLSAIRRTGRQIICTVEDPALVDLLARRLRSDAGDHGAIVRLRYETGTGSVVAERTDVGPFAKQVLVPRRAG